MDIFGRQEKVQRYEDFVDRRLKPDLVRAVGERSDLRKNIENLEKNGVSSLRSLVNLGSEVYLEADVPDTRHIFVDVGLGFHVEFTWSEAINFILVKEASLNTFVKVLESCSNFMQSDTYDAFSVCNGAAQRQVLLPSPNNANGS
ncbi:hypothetical protein IFM89_003102 [Coptis chinensis]|uniref:Protein UXT homolog n=1 Tax=Coptis chinensis TaxID=261450 RepID=A0A835MH28_9MAGN|nr:hypothetical protein IFM89_003102 [Coptis chinensis]